MTCTGFAFLVAILTCEPAAAPVPDAARFCQIARPITWHPTDTAATRRQVKRHNAAWVAACRSKTR